MSDETTNAETTTTEQPVTPAGAQNAEQQPPYNTFPFPRLEELNKAKKPAEAELAKLRKAAEDADKATLAEQNKYQELYEQAEAKAAALEKRFEEVQTQVKRDSIKAAIEAAARAANFADPADAYVFLDLDSIEVGDDGKPKEVDMLVKGLAKSKSYLVAQHEVQQGNGARPKMAGHGAVDADAQKQVSLARAQASF